MKSTTIRMDKHSIIDIQCKASWISSLALAANVILLGDKPTNENRFQNIVLDLMDAMVFIADEIENIAAAEIEEQEVRNFNSLDREQEDKA
jgi:hypothetical protein